MANILDIRRRIRSVVNTRQITKAMKTVSAAKLRRAQEGAFAARPYSQMLTNVLKSLVSRADIYDPITGLPRHPLLAERPEKNILLIVVTGDKGLAGAFNTNILKMVSRFIESKPDAIRSPQRSPLPVERPEMERRASRPTQKSFRRAPVACRSQANISEFWARSIIISQMLSARA